MVYTNAGGSYVVARENFGPVVAQVGAVALMVDYIVTVAVQAAAGTAAVTSAVPAESRGTTRTSCPLITVGVILLLFYGNLRGLREAGRTFAFPTYFFSGSMLIMIITGLVREIFGDLPHYHPASRASSRRHRPQRPHGLGMVFVLLKSFANGGSSLTGLEAISNGVSAFQAAGGPQRPQGARDRT